MNDRREYHRKYYQERKAMLKAVKEVKINPSNDLKQLLIEDRAGHVEYVPEKDSDSLNDVKNVYRWFACAVIAVFLVLNTSFLVNEQIRFYELKHYTFKYSLFISLLSETAVILLSFFFAQSKLLFHRIVLGSILFMTVACILSIIYLGVERSQSEAEKNGEISMLMRKELQQLNEELFDKPKLSSAIQKKERELKDFLKSHEILSSSIETLSLLALRGLSVAWNVVFSILIAFVFQEKYAK